MKVQGKITEKNSKFFDLIIEERISDNIIRIDESKSYQTFKGCGGAFSESSCYIYSLLSKKQKEEVIKAYFSKSGLRYNLARLTIGSCDFSLNSYDYIINNDLSSFSLAHEEKYLLPFLKDALKSNDLWICASSWSPLAYMKDNDDKLHGGRLKKEYYDEYADYLLTYVKKMKELGINISMITPQNEVEAIQIWESCLYSPKEEVELMKLIKSKLNQYELNELKIYVHDHNRDHVYERVKEMLRYVEPSFIDGVAYHWYDYSNYSSLTLVHELLPNAEILFSEGCVELLLLKEDEELGSIRNGLRYGRNYILDSLNYVSGFIDWNLLLDSKGGPNHVGNFCEAPIMYDIETKELIYNYSYYVIKHFSSFIEVGARRVEVSSDMDGVLLLAYKNMDDSLVLIALNESKGKEITLQIENKNYSWYLNEDSIVSIKIERCE